MAGRDMPGAAPEGPRGPGLAGAAALALVLAVLFGALAALSASQPTLPADGELGPGTAFPLLLTGAEGAEEAAGAEGAEEAAGAEGAEGAAGAEGALSFSFQLGGGVGSVDVMAFGPFSPGGSAELRVNGELADSRPLAEQNCLARTAGLDAGGLSGEAVLTLTGVAGSTGAFADTGGSMRSTLGAASQMGVFETGLLCAVMVYGATLYAFKRSEGYMLSFSLYVLVLILQVSLFSRMWEGPMLGWLYYPASRCTVAATVLLSVSICYRLASVPAPGWAARLLGARGVAALSAATALAALLLWSRVGLAIDYAVYGAGALAALYGCARCERRSFYIPATLLVSTLACGCGTLLSFLRLSRGFLYCALLTTPPLFSIPFVIAAMVAVNRRFARKFREAEELNAELDRLVAERTRGLHEQEAQRKQLMINVFHDLRSPLFVLQDLAASSEAGPEAALRNATLIRERVGHLTRLTNDLFYLAKLEEGRVIFSEDLFDAGVLARQAAEAWRVPAAERGVTVELGEVEEAPVVGDETRLKEALDNLLANAVRHTPAGRAVRVSVTREPEAPGAVGAAEGAGRRAGAQGRGAEEPGAAAGRNAGEPGAAGAGRPGRAEAASQTGRPSRPDASLASSPAEGAPRRSAVIRVADEGAGIAPEDLGRVFQQYYSKSSDKESRSTGIGLSIAKEVVERMGGSIEAASELGRGTTMTVRLPLEEPGA